MEYKDINLENVEIPIVRIPIQSYQEDDITYIPVNNQIPIQQDLDEVSVSDLPGTIIPEPFCNACQQKDYDISDQYGIFDPNGYFKLENLFSELIDPYQRAIARQHLGIADVYAQIWGNISGNLSDQKDLYDIITNKANLQSPTFTGTPTVPLASSTDDSNMIASTKWVNNRLSELGTVSTNLSSFTATPTYIYIGDSSTNITLNWKFINNVTQQSINGIDLGLDVRTFTFNNVSTTTAYTLQYTYNDIIQTSKLTISNIYPIYYGTNLTNLTKTANKTITIDAGTSNYIYIKINKESDFTVNGFTGGFKLLNTQTLLGTTYYTYQSVNSGLGNTTITIT